MTSGISNTIIIQNSISSIKATLKDDSIPLRTSSYFQDRR